MSFMKNIKEHHDFPEERDQRPKRRCGEKVKKYLFSK